MKKCFYLSFLFLLISTYFVGAGNSELDKKSFNENANKYGNKSANLMELEKIAKSLVDEGQKISFAVPAIFPVSHDEIKEFLDGKLEKVEGNELLDYWWSEFVEKQKKNKKSTVIDPEAAKVLENIESAILEAFTPKKGESAFTIKNIEDEERQSKLKNFLSEAQDEKILLMVRSTGREDSKELSNAGGNASVSSVPADINQISEAMGVVVASYFSKKSIGQRLAAGDKTLLSKPQFMPVLFQYMIGEPVGGDEKKIPASGVMFSQEAEGRTPGVIQVQATWGHNEAVVNGLTAVDTFYIGSSGIVYPVIRVKNKRLVSVEKDKRNVLDLVDNPGEVRSKPCLNANELRALKKAADTISEYYKAPQDIEFVVLGNTVYLIQTRPLEEQEINPSYLTAAYVKTLSDDTRLTGETIGFGGGSVRVVTNKNHIIVSDNIRQALQVFLDEENKDEIECVIVGEMAPATSHEATQFRASGKPVLYLEKQSLDALKSWIKKGTFVLGDFQREMLASFSSTDDFKDTKDVIVKGWFAHPIPMMVSVFDKYLKKVPSDKQKELFSMKGIDKDRRKTGKISEWLKGLKEADNKDNASIYLRLILDRLRNVFLVEVKKAEQVDAEYKKELKQLMQHAISYAYEILQVFESLEKYTLPSDKQRLLQLYPIKFLEALLMQHPRLDVVSQFSWAEHMRTGKHVSMLMKKKETKPEFAEGQEEYALIYAKTQEFAYSDSVKKDWQSFLYDVAGVAKKSKVIGSEFRELITNIVKGGFLSAWLNLSFPQAWNESKEDAEKTVQSLLVDYAEADSFLRELKEKKAQLESLNMDAWSDPEKFDTQWKAFQDTILSYFLTDTFINALDKINLLGKTAALSTMQLLVDTFDQSIKALTGSKKKYEGKIKVLIKRFEGMLQIYFDLLKKWSSVSSLTNVLDGLVSQSSYQKYKEVIEQLLREAPRDESTMSSSSSFNVSANTIGSKVDFWGSTSDPTLESLFSLIHQNLIIIMSMLSKNAFGENVVVPPLIKLLQETIDKYFKEKKIRTYSLVGIGFDDQYITYYYNVPMRTHSAIYRLVYGVKSGSANLICTYMGTSPIRWFEIGGLVEVASKVFGLKMSVRPEIDGDKGLLVFGWEITSQDTKAVDYVSYLLSLIMAREMPYSPYSDERTQDIIELTNTIKILGNKSEEDAKKTVIDTIVSLSLQSDSLAYVLLGQLYYDKEARKDWLVEAAYKGIESENVGIKTTGLNLFTFLVNQGEEFEKAIEVAQVAFKTKNSDVRRAASGLFERLLKQGQGYKEAIETAVGGIQDKDDYIRRDAEELFERLFSKKQGYKEASKAARECLQSTDEDIQRAGSDLFDMLLEEGHGYDDAVEVVKGLMLSKDSSALSASLALLKTLVGAGRVYDMAAEAAKKGMSNEDVIIQEKSLSLLEVLVKKGKAYEVAEEAVKKGMINEDVIIQEKSLSLLEVLVKKGKAYEVAKNTAMLLMNSKDKKTRRKALDLFKTLVKKEEAYNDATEAAKLGIKASDFYIRSKALSLLNTLVQKDQAYKEATEAAKLGIKDDDSVVRADAIQLFTNLVKKDKAYEEAAKVVEQFKDDKDYTIKMSLKKLRKTLEKK